MDNLSQPRVEPSMSDAGKRRGGARRTRAAWEAETLDPTLAKSPEL
jgi:hypothetical protein